VRASQRAESGVENAQTLLIKRPGDSRGPNVGDSGRPRSRPGSAISGTHTRFPTQPHRPFAAARYPLSHDSGASSLSPAAAARFALSLSGSCPASSSLPLRPPPLPSVIHSHLFPPPALWTIATTIIPKLRWHHRSFHSLEPDTAPSTQYISSYQSLLPPLASLHITEDTALRCSSDRSTYRSTYLPREHHRALPRRARLRSAPHSSVASRRISTTRPGGIVVLRLTAYVRAAAPQDRDDIHCPP
jgi:hypothetical protein